MTQVWAHRGANRVAPENTPAAFAAAAELGADGVELDVWRHEGDLVVVHDVPTGGHPTLAEALEACRGMVVDVEIKGGDGVVEAVLDAVQGHEVILSSFSLDVVDRIRSLDDEVPVGLVVMAGDVLAAARLCHERGYALHPFHSLVDAALVEVGVPIHTWTVNEPARIATLAALGVDAVITDVPDVARAALRDE